MELTRKIIELLADGSIVLDYGDTKIIAKQLLAEMDKPKVWTNAPDNAIIAQVHFYKAAKTYATPTAVPEVYTRKLPKSRIDEIAEEAADIQIKACGIVGGSWCRDKLVESYKSAILKDREDRGAK